MQNAHYISHAANTGAAVPAVEPAAADLLRKKVEQTKLQQRDRSPGWNLYYFAFHVVNAIGFNLLLSVLSVKSRWSYNNQDKPNAIPKEKLLLAKKIPFTGGKNFFELTGGIEKAFDERVTKKWIAKAKTEVGKENARELGNNFTDILLLSWSGWVAQGIIQISELRPIKTRAIPMVDKYITDPVRSLFGKGPSEAELKDRKERIYKSLNEDFDREPIWRVVTSRALGLLFVLGSSTGFNMADRAINRKRIDRAERNGNTPPAKLERKFAGINRIPAIVADTTELGYEALGKEPPAWAARDKGMKKDSLATAMAQNMSLDVYGTLIIWAISTTFLKFKEFFRRDEKLENKVKAELKAEAEQNKPASVITAERLAEHEAETAQARPTTVRHSDRAPRPMATDRAAAIRDAQISRELDPALQVGA